METYPYRDTQRERTLITMGKVLPEIGPREEAFIASQKVFFVATAPLDPNHHVSVSPKANGCVVLDPHTVVYADLSGSGAETAAHLLQNGRMTLLFSNLEAGPPKILRLFGRAEVILAENVAPSLLRKLPSEITRSPGFRAVYKLRVSRISTSCGYSLPIFDFVKSRHVLDEFAEKLGTRGMFDYNTKKNSFSIDGLPSLALLRNGAPAVDPVEEEGFVFGKEVAKKPSLSSSNNGSSWKTPATMQLLPVYQTARRVNVRVRDLVLSAWLLLFVGVGAGMIAERHIAPRFIV